MIRRRFIRRGKHGAEYQADGDPRQDEEKTFSPDRCDAPTSLHDSACGFSVYRVTRVGVAKADSINSFCSMACIFFEPVEGLADSGREMNDSG